MKFSVSSTEYYFILDLNETSLGEYLTCLDQQYPLNDDEDSYMYLENKKGRSRP